MNKPVEAFERELIKGYLGGHIQEQRDFWLMTRKAKAEYILDHARPQDDPNAIDNGFYYYLQHTYGIKLHLENGHIKPDYEIIDEQAYLVFVLKYST